MSKRLTASGVLYTSGYKVGTSGYTIADDYLQTMIQKSPDKIPVVADFSKGFLHDPNNLIGYATMKYVEPRDPYPGYIRATIVFNNRSEKTYYQLLESSKDRVSLHLGFYMTRVKFRSEDNQLRNGIISAIALGKDCLGGLIDKFGWEDTDDG